MASRRHGGSDVVYDDRRERDYYSRGGPRYDDRYTDQEIEFRRSAPPVREREEIDIREDRSRARDPPAFLREDYGRTSAGPMVLRAREREDFDFSARNRRRSPSVESERKVERESIVIRRDREEADSRPPPRRERSREREEIIIRRDEREKSRPAPPPPPPPQDDVQREEIIIRREERSQSRGPVRGDRETEKIIIKRSEEEDRGPRYSYAPPPRDYDRDRDYGYAASRPKSRERERSSVRHDGSDSEREIIIRRDETKGRGRNATREREEIIIRDRSRSSSRSPSPAQSARSMRSSRPVPAEPQIVYAPQIHQEVITHHRHVDHGYELAIAPRSRPVSRPPSPPSPPPPQPPPPARERSEERIEIRRSGERNGQAYDEDIIIDRNEGGKSAPPARYDTPPRRERYEREYEEESAYYDQRALARPLPRPAPMPAPGGDIGRRYGKTPDPKAGLWTEITKDLVVKEAITEMGYEYEETDEFYYVIAYLGYDDVARLVGLSEDIRKDRRQRVKELEWEQRIEPEAPPPARRPLPIGPPPGARPPRGGWDREDDRYIEREIVYRGGRPPPPPGWRR